MEQTKTGNVTDILKLMNRASEGFAYEIFIPSLDRNVMFRQINTSQQKRLLKAIIDSPAYNTEFIFALKQIIEENCIEKLNIGDFTIMDKLIISLVMRSKSIGNDFKITFNIPKPDVKKDEETTEVKEVPVTLTVNLAELAVEALKHAKIAPITVTDDKGIFDVVCSLPTISDEFNLENQLRKNNNQIDINNESELRETIGNVFINELVKYIKIINIHDLEAGTTIEIDLKNIDVKSRIQILGQLPSLVIKKVIDYIGTVNKEIEQVLLFKYNLGDKVIEERLKIDASFFTLS